MHRTSVHERGAETSKKSFWGGWGEVGNYWIEVENVLSVLERLGGFSVNNFAIFKISSLT